MKKTYQLEGEPPRHFWRWFGIVMVVLVALSAVVLGIAWLRVSNMPQPVSYIIKTHQAGEGISTKMLFVGDVFWGRSIQTKAQASNLGYKYLTSGLSGKDRASYDAWIANFECPITDKDVPYASQVKYLKFNCRPEYLQNLAKWFTAASQANNHTENQGEWGLKQTRKNLETAGIQYFGDYDMNKTDNICEVISVPAKTVKTGKVVQLPIALCGYMYVVDVTPSDKQLAVMKKYAQVMPVIAMPHMGVEYRSSAEAAKVSAYERMIDNGADAVIGAHPHVIQNSESYKGKLIAFSEGNFLFDQQSLGRATTLGLGVGLTLTISDAKAAGIYQKLAPNCVAYKDDCLDSLNAQLKQRPTIGVSYDFTCYDEAGGTPRLGTKSTCDKARADATVSKLTDLATTW
ncbi:CapA family protein [Candidatus Saccharibacteria bacterium]|nr:CapA family protein [Candidatus Saccharibacteria bacterium]